MKFLLLFAIFLFSFSSFAIQCPQNEYQMFCRGKMPAHVFNSYTMFYMAKNDRKSGEFGRFLKPNTCAWYDRPIGPAEPVKIYFSRDLDGSNVAQIQAAFASMADSTSTIEFCARTTNDGYFFADLDPGVMRWFPVFR